MDITLVKLWNGLPIGYQLVGVQAGQAELMISQGTAIVTALPVVAKQNTYQERTRKNH